MSVKLKEDILKMRFEEVYGEFKKKSLTCEEASLILGVSARTFLRKRDRYEEDDFDGIFDLRLGKCSNRRANDSEVEVLTKLYQEKYRDFSVKHFYEFYRLHPNMTRSYNWCRLKLQKVGLVSKSKQGGPHRLRRARKPMSGMMVHQDGSTHGWIPEFDHNVDLIVTMDDATSEITSAFFVEQEGTMSSLRGIKETIENYGLFCSFYTDRGSHYAYTPESGGKIDKGRLTQVGRALKQLGIKHIHAYSPQARGRSERMFGTLQNRLPKELALHGITSMEEANRYLRETYLPVHNKNFSKAASSQQTAYVPWGNKDSLNESLCIKEDRIVQKDNTVRYKSIILQIPPHENRRHYVKAEVEVREYLDRTIAIFYGHMCLGRYDQVGNLLPTTSQGQQVAA